LDRGKQCLLGLVETKPDDPFVAAREGADFLYSDVPHPAAVGIKSAGDDAAP